MCSVFNNTTPQSYRVDVNMECGSPKPLVGFPSPPFGSQLSYDCIKVVFDVEAQNVSTVCWSPLTSDLQ
eukprot:m.19254 g.19254  ORF g.19254 m.19254 type:complete len:69 (-) comp12197_c0_seq1:1731-1937(-)